MCRASFRSARSTACRKWCFGTTESVRVMSFQRVKVWQWVLIGLFVGCGLGYAWISQADLEGPGTIQPTRFYRQLSNVTDDGRPVVQDIVIEPVRLGPSGEKIQRVRYNLLMRNKETQQWDPIPHDTIVTVPFLKTPDADPDNRVSDYLKSLKEKIPALDYRYALAQVSTLEADVGEQTGMKAAFLRGLPADPELAWWQKSTNAWIVAIGGGVLLIGVVWPMVIRLLVKMGLGMPEDDTKGVDLSKVSTATAPSVSMPTMTAGDRSALDDLNAQLEGNVAGMLMASDEKDDAEDRRVAGRGTEGRRGQGLRRRVLPRCPPARGEEVGSAC
jgi:hypothetical protein